MSAKWSYSSMNLFQQCPKKYYHLRVVKNISEPPSHQMRYGLEAHKAAEEYVRDGAPLAPAFGFMQEPLDRLRQLKGDMYCEHKMGLTYDLTPCNFNAPNAWWRGIADLLVVNGPQARIIDYKTGKNSYADTKQLELLALATFKYFPLVKIVKAGLLFVVHAAFVTEKYGADNQADLWVKWFKQTDELDAAYSNDVWNPKQNFTCRAWCPVTNCVHNGREVV